MKKRIRVLNVVDGCGWCGTKEQTFLISKLLSETFETHLAIAFGYSMMEKKVKDSNCSINLHYFQDLKKPRYSFGNIFRLRNIIGRVKPNVIIAHSSVSLNYVLLASFFLKDKPSIIGLKRSDFDPNFLSRKFKYGICDKIVVTSSFLEGKFKKYWGDKLISINSGIELERFYYDHKCRMEMRKNLGFSDETKVFINVANWQPWRKGQDKILEAFASLKERLRDWKLIFVGHDTDSDEAKSLIKKYSLEERVICLGFRPDVEKYLQAADYFVFASFNETLAAAVVQAMASGKVVISTLAGGIGEYLKDGYNGFAVPVGDVDALSQAILKASSLSKGEYKTIAGRAVETAKKYSIEETGRKWKELIESLCR